VIPVFRMDTLILHDLRLVRYTVKVWSGDALREIPFDTEMDPNMDPEEFAVWVLQGLIDGIKDHDRPAGSLRIPRDEAIRIMEG